MDMNSGLLFLLTFFGRLRSLSVDWARCAYTTHRECIGKAFGDTSFLCVCANNAVINACMCNGGGNASKLPFRCDHFSIIIFFHLCALSFLLFFIFDSLHPIWNCWWRWQWRLRLWIRFFHFFIFLLGLGGICVSMNVYIRIGYAQFLGLWTSNDFFSQSFLCVILNGIR